MEIIRSIISTIQVLDIPIASIIRTLQVKMIQNWVVWAIASFLGHSTVCMQVRPNPYVTFDKDAKHFSSFLGILATHTIDRHFLAELISNAI